MSVFSKIFQSRRTEPKSQLLFREGLPTELEARVEALRTERDELATVMSAISDAVLAINSDETVLFYNTRLVSLFGGEGLESRSRLREIFKQPDVLGAYDAAIRENRMSALTAVPFEDGSGRRFFSISVSPLRKGTEAVYGAVGVFHDVTDLKKAEQIRIDFVANVSHELRTPLTAIKGYADTLIQDFQEGRSVQKEFVEIIARNTERLMNLINDLLDLSSLETGESSHAWLKCEVSPREITDRVIRQMRGVVERKKHSIKVEYEVETVQADSHRLEQVLVNLFENAVKYTPSGGLISILWKKVSGSAVVLKITDSGPGIPAEHHARLFERFYRVDKARSREQGGTGLGLAIVKHIMQRHGGSVEVESAPGRGSSFICVFPG
ncbi:MAG TPA: ATP-binding protein [Bdellovibrionota bacterium]|nr:ATP-binding protein [Bdellovibrionota bacterium]